MTYEFLIVGIGLFYLSVALSHFLIKKSQVENIALLNLSKTAKGRGQVQAKKDEISKNLILKSLFWPFSFVARNEKKAKK